MIRLGDLRILLLACTGLAITVGAVALGLMLRPAIDPVQRPVLSWTPLLDLTAPGWEHRQDATLVDALARPLFRQSRRPFDPATLAGAQAAKAEQQVQPETPPPQPQPAVTVRGVLIGKGMEQALLVSPELPQGQWFAAGASVQGWTLASIGPEGVVLTSGDQKLALKLYVDNPAKSIGSP